jgi:hypothetical protein
MRAEDLHKGDVIELDRVFYTVLDKRPPSKTHSRFQLQTLAGSVVQVDIEHDTEIKVFK